MDRHTLVGRGRAADVYAHGDGLVLRRYRTAHDCLYEAAVMQHVHDHGYPVPAVHEVAGRDIVMERVDGPTMLADISRRPWTVARHMRTLADLHRRLGAVPAAAWMPAPLGEGDAVVHMDLHPDNVILTGRGPVVIDWSNAVRGPAAYDVAYTWVIVATSVAPTPWQRVLLRGFRRLALGLFLRHVDREAAADQLVAAARRRLGDRNLLAPDRAMIDRFLSGAAGRAPARRRRRGPGPGAR
jgi:Ser/Thr protein kinase RdoA (MazF antagonist)